MKKVILSIDGMTCSACSIGLEKYLNKQDGITKATVNLIMNTASIEYDEKKLNISNLEKFVEKAGFKSLGIDNFEKKKNKEKNKRNKLICISVFSIIIMYISMSHMLCLPIFSFLDLSKNPLNYCICLNDLTIIVLI